MIRLLCLFCLIFITSCKDSKKVNVESQPDAEVNELALKIKSLEENWVPESRVTEKSRGPLIVFQGHDHEVVVDWAFEVNKENSDKSIRHFPVDIIIMNNSYEIIEFENNELPLFHFEVRNSFGNTVKKFISIQKAKPLMPGEKVHCMLQWDGRDVDGKYALPGRYNFVTEVSKLKGHSKLKISRDFIIKEAGPRVKVILSDDELMLRRIDEFNRINNALFGR